MKNYNDYVESTVDALSAIITKEGYSFLYLNSFYVYESLLDNGFDNDISSIILFALVSNVGKKSKKKESVESEIKALPLDSDAESFLTAVFTSLYSSRRKAGMKKKEYAGLEEFLSKEWTVDIYLQAEWAYKFGTRINYSFDYTITFSASDRDVIKKYLTRDLMRNPFLTASDILEKYRKELQESVNSDFESYCTADDYYEPNVEDYDSESGDGAIEDYLEDHGFEFLESSYDYRDDSPW